MKRFKKPGLRRNMTMQFFCSKESTQVTIKSTLTEINDDNDNENYNDDDDGDNDGDDDDDDDPINDM